MLLLDVNVLIYAFRADAVRHDEYREWLRRLRRGAEPVAAAATVLASFLRIVTHPRIFREPDTMADGLEFVAALRGSETYVEVAPGARHWAIFIDLCKTLSVRGNLVPDAYLAALAIETGSTWVTTDRDFARFPGLRWQHPLEH